jgi:hypothetical protein
MISATYFYIMTETEVDYRFDGSDYVRQEHETKYAKFGITLDKLWERLRKLQQGNPRDLKFKYLWIGDSNDIVALENLHKADWRREWTNGHAETLRDLTTEHIAAHGLNVLPVPLSYPYGGQSKNTCRFRSMQPLDHYKLLSPAIPAIAINISEILQFATGPL